MRLTLVAIFTVLFLVACSSNPYFNAAKPHHTESGFNNLYIDDSAKGFSAFMKWKSEQWGKELPKATDYDFPIDRSQHETVVKNTRRDSVTWIGHATFLLQLNGMNILTDPHFTERASPVSWAGPKRVVPPAMSITQLPLIHAIVISHDHYDSLDIDTIIALSAHNTEQSIHVFVPLGLKAWFDDLELGNLRVTELDWGESAQLGKLNFTAEPVQHWGKRTLFDAFERLWASWVIEAPTRRVFFAGDSGYVSHFRDIGEKYQSFDLALIPIGAYAPRWFMKTYHVNPEEAVKIHQDVRSNYSIAMHWGTFILTDEPLDKPPVKLAEALKAADVEHSKFDVFQHGQTRFMD